MNYLIAIIAILPVGIMAQTSKPTFTASVCLHKKVIQIKVVPSEPSLEIYRRAENERNYSLIGRMPDSILQDRLALCDKWYFYQFKMPDGKFSPQEAKGRVCSPSSKMAVIPYQPLDRTAQNIDFQWSALYNVQKYQLQVARNEDDFSFETGFLPENILLDTTISTNIVNWKSGLNINDTLYWAVKPILEGDKTCFMNPITTIVNPYPLFSNPGIVVNINNLEIKQNKVTFQLKNNTKLPLKDVKLHYFLSNKWNFTLDALLLKTQSFETLAPDELKHVEQELSFSRHFISNYLLIVPFVNGRFLKSQLVVKEIPHLQNKERPILPTSSPDKFEPRK